MRVKTCSLNNLCKNVWESLREEKLGFGVRISRDLCGAYSLVQDLARRKLGLQVQSDFKVFYKP